MGSYYEQKCPVGTYAKYLATTSKENCIKCKVGWYQDQLGQPGCKKCGPTSTSFGGATTCQCIGENRQFVKSIGACLCKQGYHPKNWNSTLAEEDETDSTEDCEAKVTQTCRPDQDID